MKSKVKEILRNLDLRPNKHLGQNFLIDEEILQKILDYSNVSKQDEILEIGPGLGILTEKLLQFAGKVHGIEIDHKLAQYLQEKFHKLDNFHLIEADILKVELPNYSKVVSNIPYSITGPLFEKVFFRSAPVSCIVTIEKRLADRIFYEKNYKNFSRITVSVNSFLKPMERMDIPRSSFYPAPKIPLNLIKLNPRENINSFLQDKEARHFYLDFIAGIMPYKNKKMSNALVYFSKSRDFLHPPNKKTLKAILKEQEIADKKVFMYSIQSFIKLAKIMYSYR
ncbi:MAG: 16S rRNA (adenine(1518)-N(6)/adenine(1519)-N(6))-dimethyltransferase RsmA [Promethearchaeia archaeon]